MLKIEVESEGSQNVFDGDFAQALSPVIRIAKEDLSDRDRPVFDFGSIICLTVESIGTFAPAVAASLLANWLYGKLRQRPITALRINGVPVEIDEEHLARLIKRLLTEEPAAPPNKTDRFPIPNSEGDAP